MSKRTLRAPITLPFCEERTQLGKIPLISGLHPRHTLQLHRRGTCRGDAPLNIPTQFDISLLLRRHPSPIGVALGYRRDGIFAALLGQYPVSYLNRKTVLQIIDAHLTNILRSSTSTANFNFLKPSPCAGLPREDSKWDVAYFAFFAVRFLGHSNVGVVAEASFAYEGEFGLFPFLLVVVAFDGGHVILDWAWWNETLPL